ncbi:MAG: nucleotidyltransferase [Clostridia bacterium]|nr:nucleotidyltransferase [Clostridia bacterium]
MNKPVLVIMAAGMGSRYGGLKQIDPVDEEGHKIIDFSIYDAYRAGFEKAVFIIKKENREEFETCIGNAVSSKLKVEYVYQELTDIPDGFTVPKDRIKPWGTAHAILSARKCIDGPFAVINADDYYGPQAFKEIYQYLSLEQSAQNQEHYAMVGYKLGNTLTDNGYVSRGVCSLDGLDFLTDIVERTHIVKTEQGAAYTEDDITYVPISKDSIVSMNLWGFTDSFIKYLNKAFETFMEEEVPKNPLKAECYLPFVVDGLLKEGKADVKVLKSNDKWFGVTYKEDKPFVMEAIRLLKEAGVYPAVLWK